MALSIGPTGFKGLSKSEAQNTKTSPSASPQTSTFNNLRTDDGGAVASSDSVSFTSPREQAESTASNALFEGSLLLNEVEDVTEQLSKTTDKIYELAKELDSEPSPLRQEELQKEIEDLTTEAETQYAQALDQNPAIAENTEITAVVKPGAEPEDAQKTATVSIQGASSPAELGITGLNYDRENLEATIDELENIRNRQQIAESGYKTARAQLTEPVKEVGRQVDAKIKASNNPNVDALADSLQKQITAVGSEALPPVERITNVEELLTDVPPAEDTAARDAEPTQRSDDSIQLAATQEDGTPSHSTKQFQT